MPWWNDVTINNSLPVSMLWPWVVLFSTLCRTTSGLTSSDAPRSSTPALNEDGTRTLTVPGYDAAWGRRKKRKTMTQKKRSSVLEGKLRLALWICSSYCAFTFLTVEVSAAAVSHIDINASAVRGNLQETIWTICKSKANLRCFAFSGHWWIPYAGHCAISQSAYL